MHKIKVSQYDELYILDEVAPLLNPDATLDELAHQINHLIEEGQVVAHWELLPEGVYGYRVTLAPTPKPTNYSPLYSTVATGLQAWKRKAQEKGDTRLADGLGEALEAVNALYEAYKPDYRAARGALAWDDWGEPAEVSIRRLRG